MKLRVLLLEDDLLVRDMLRTTLQRQGYEVEAYSTPARCPVYLNFMCRCELRAPCADVILTDVDMPKVKGLQFVARLKERGCACAHIAAMSANWSDNDLEKAAGLGCTIFAKPFDMAQVKAWLRDVERAVAETRRAGG